MRYGTIPLVRRTGGLADTVFDGLNGFVFEKRSGEEFLSTCKRAVAVYSDGPKWRKLVTTAMSADYSWERSAKAYADLYEHAVELRRQGGASALAEKRTG
jgi:starch synthase